MRLTTRTNLALRTLMVCAVNTDRLVRKQDVACVINASENHLAQVINKLAQEGFITTQRGRHGGFSLNRAASSIGVGEVFRAFEADLPLIECFSEGNTCPFERPLPHGQTSETRGGRVLMARWMTCICPI